MPSPGVETEVMKMTNIEVIHVKGIKWKVSDGTSVLTYVVICYLPAKTVNTRKVQKFGEMKI